MSLPQLFRARFTLTARADIALPPHDPVVLYALLAEAVGIGLGVEPDVPDAVGVDAPERLRGTVRAGQPYAFGLTLLAASPARAAELLRAVRAGLDRLGRQRAADRVVLGGNYDLARTEDLVAGADWTDGPLAPIPYRLLEDEVRRVADLGRATVHFRTPLRLDRPPAARAAGHACFDGDWFDPVGFLRKLDLRLTRCGWPLPPDTSAAPPAVAANELVWLDLSYAPRDAKPLAGAAGRVAFAGLTEAVAWRLVLGQYVGLGEWRKFGFGAYRIDELGPHPYPCRRSVGLLDLAFGPDLLADAGNRYGVSVSDLLVARSAAPLPPHRVAIPKPGGGVRTLAIPAAIDRALQYAVHKQLAPALDAVLEKSSTAYRRGLGRDTAANAVRAAVRGGFTVAVKSDFRRFFDEVDHRELEARLTVYVGDDEMVAALMRWVRSASPEPTRGLPTGSPLSPLLANLFLDQFDERVAAEGGRLVRYADDFVILCRSREEADRLFRSAEAEAGELRLALNASKTSLLDLRHPFEFLGFRFAPTAGDWRLDGGGGPEHVADIGWEQVAGAPPAPAGRLPGEADVPSPDPEPCLVLGPNLAGVYVSDGHILAVQAGETESYGFPLAGLEQLILLGQPPLGAGAVVALAQAGVTLVLADDSGRELGVLTPHFGPDDPDAILAQAVAMRDEVFRLSVARRFVAAKLRNYAAVAEAFPAAGPDRVAASLRDLAGRALAALSAEQLLGFEGAGARAWYSSLGTRLPPGFRFARRVAPDADDPVNVLLNIAHTHLYRLASLAIRAAGLSPALGVLHERRAGFHALAADVMEPFRHLVDRTVLASLRWLTPRDFRPASDGRYRLTIRPGAAREFTAAATTALAWPVSAADGRPPRAYRNHLIALVRNLKRLFRDPNAPLTVFEHPAPPAGGAPP